MFPLLYSSVPVFCSCATLLDNLDNLSRGAHLVP
jgi:hypothetical protein